MFILLGRPYVWNSFEFIQKQNSFEFKFGNHSETRTCKLKNTNKENQTIKIYKQH